MKYAAMTPCTIMAYCNGVLTAIPGAQGGAPVELTEKQITDYKAEGKVIVAFDDAPQVETVTLEKTVAEAMAKKAGIVLAAECTAEDVQAAIEADAKEEPKEEAVELKP